MNPPPLVPGVPSLRVEPELLAQFESATSEICKQPLTADEQASSRTSAILNVLNGPGRDSNVTREVLSQQDWHTQRSSDRHGYPIRHVVDPTPYVYDANGTLWPTFGRIFAIKKALLAANPGDWISFLGTDVPE